jgi:hypothetical protein
MKKLLMIFVAALLFAQTTAQTEGSGLTQTFQPVTSQKFKLVIQNEKQAPSINEAILFRAE